MCSGKFTVAPRPIPNCCIMSKYFLIISLLLVNISVAVYDVRFEFEKKTYLFKCRGRIHVSPPIPICCIVYKYTLIVSYLLVYDSLAVCDKKFELGTQTYWFMCRGKFTVAPRPI